MFQGYIVHFLLVDWELNISRELKVLWLFPPKTISVLEVARIECPARGTFIFASSIHSVPFQLNFWIIFCARISGFVPKASIWSNIFALAQESAASPDLFQARNAARFCRIFWNAADPLPVFCLVIAKIEIIDESISDSKYLLKSAREYSPSFCART